MPSYADQYLAARARSSFAKTPLGRFAAGLDFDLDDFQLEACRAVEDGEGVLVAAPTGAGKTVVGEFAVHLARAEGAKAFYTTPIKALSNQKYQDLVRVHSADSVGLLTGDVSVNTEAPILVMTTEVLRNMLYAGSPTLRGLRYVVMDEVHYLADRFRGAVWEEVIIHLPASVSVISLSATISNAEEFGQWLDAVRGSTRVVVSEHRPVPLWQHVMVGSRMFDLFSGDTTIAQAADIVRDRGADQVRVNPDLLQATSHRTGPRRGRRGGQSPRTPRTRRAPRPVVLQEMDREGLLPSIVFIFSRAACDDAVRQCIDADLRLTDDRQAQLIRAYLAEATAGVPLKDLRVLGFDTWREGLTRGIAAHHAGMLPLFKEIVEQLFSQGLVKAVFATETLALGINMPARSVVLEKLTKFNGERHVDISPGEYTQLTGRAGRRGIDVEGHAVVLWNDGMDAKSIAGLASRRTYPLYSSFKPTYNMSVNLLDRFGVERTMTILESSFAQFQADRSVVSQAAKVRRQEQALAGYEESMTCHLGDYAEYADLKYRLNQLEKKSSRDRRFARRAVAADDLRLLQPGDILEVPHGKHAGHAVVIARPQEARDVQVGVVTEAAQLRQLRPEDFAGAVRPVSRAKVPKGFAPRSAQERRDMASRMFAALREHKPPRAISGAREADFDPARDTRREEIDRLRAAVETHPCHGCSHREEHARWFNRWVRLRRETDALRREIDSRTSTIAHRFQRITDLLTDYGFVERGGEHEELRLTPLAAPLRRIYGERDLLTSLALSAGVFDDLDPAALAAAVTAVVHEGKREATEFLGRYPAGLGERMAELRRIWQRLTEAERHHRLPETPAPDVGLMWSMHRWAQGDSLAQSLENSGLAAGDFVRAAKQVIDALDQLGHARPEDADWRTLCEAAAARVRRGVVLHELDPHAQGPADAPSRENLPAEDWTEEDWMPGGPVEASTREERIEEERR